MNYKDSAKHTSFGSIDLELIGGWIDLAVYYSGSDGNAWKYQAGWSNAGPSALFKALLVAGKIRGELLPEHQQIANPELIKAAREWASDCAWRDSDDLDDMSDAEIVLGVQRHYDGGWEAFVESTTLADHKK